MCTKAWVGFILNAGNTHVPLLHGIRKSSLCVHVLYTHRDISAQLGIALIAMFFIMPTSPPVVCGILLYRAIKWTQKNQCLPPQSSSLPNAFGKPSSLDVCCNILWCTPKKVIMCKKYSFDSITFCVLYQGSFWSIASLELWLPPIMTHKFWMIPTTNQNEKWVVGGGEGYN